MVGQFEVPIAFSGEFIETILLEDSIECVFGLFDLELAVADKVANVFLEVVLKIAVFTLEVATTKIFKVTVDLNGFAVK